MKTLLLLLLLTAHLAVAAERPAGGEAPFAKLVLVELNRVRADPPRYANYLATLRPRYRPGGIVQHPGGAPIRSKEGIAALEEAIRALRAAPPAPALTSCEPLALSARQYAAAQARSGAVGHGGNSAARLSRHGTWLDAAGENIAYGSATPERVVADLIIDDGQPSRGHRANILNRAFRVVGVGVDRHPRYGSVCVIDFAGGFKAR